MTNCKAFGFWMRILLGICGVFSLMNWGVWAVPHFLSLSSVLQPRAISSVLCIPVVCDCFWSCWSSTPGQRHNSVYIPIDMCNVYSGFQTAMYMFLCVTVSIVVVVHWMIRNIKSSFNESREMVATCAIILANLIFATIMVYAPLKNPHVGVNAMWWLVMAVPMYNCIFNKQRYLEFWVTKLRNDGLQREYDVGLDAIAAATTTNPEQNLQQ
ncbi:hypothetical protein BX661DRAFT_226230 [Kickxella alabastrina]|uniref:uncharacterized protein n=1 Tax=Kickxella alabastrina TaxID=61397 RepID=UPI00222070E0|nr:uncharacterized protein BX661DRAFT_226230 [Kickxella alabastrina]KAI7823493.1 hypothetical protein BX661DRAFT_226230 [Kickxella alabastrina]